MARIYFDNAATTWPKPESVYQAVDQAMRHLGVSYGRGHYQQGVDVKRQIEELRDTLAKRIQAPSRRNIAFTFNCTDALSTAILGLVPSNSHVVTSAAEHNSILRPLKQLEHSKSISVTIVGCDSHGKVNPVEVIAAIKPKTTLVALSHASNVTGAIQELSPIGEVCQSRGVPFLVDAAQTMGYIPVDVRELGCDLLAAAGHKGLLGPLGTGFLYFSDRIGEQLVPLRFGGTGNTGPTLDLPRDAPEKFEAGSLNVPGLLGLLAGLKFVDSQLGRELYASSRQSVERLLRSLIELKGIRLFGPTQYGQRLSVLPIQINGLESNVAAAVLDSNWAIQTRAGLHCAPLLHQALGTDACGGLVRISPGLFNTDEEFEVLIEALLAISAKAI